MRRHVYDHRAYSYAILDNLQAQLRTLSSEEDRQAVQKRIDEEKSRFMMVFGSASVTALKVPYEERHQAKANGAKWNPTLKQWEAPANKPLSLFRRWLGD